MSDDAEVTMTHSVVLSKEGKPYVSVRFERGEAVAEGSLPDCRIVSGQGFSEEEIGQLEAYLEQNAKEILRNANKISGIKNWF